VNIDSAYFTDQTTTGASQDRETYAFYFDGTFEVSDRLRLTGGLRYTYDEKEFFRRTNSGGPCTDETLQEHMQTVDGECLDIFSNAISRVGGDFSAKDLGAFNIPLPNSAFGIALDDDDDWDQITWRAVVDYDLTENNMVYLSYATGFIPGGFTETCSRDGTLFDDPNTCAPFDEETNWNVEVGMKGYFFDQSLQVNAAIYYTEYEDLVRSQVVNFVEQFGRATQETINVNAGTSTATGFEVESTWLPMPNMQITANIAYLDSEYDDFELFGEDLSDKNVPFSPEWQAGGSVTYDQNLSPGTLSYTASFAYQDELEMSVFNSPQTQIESRTLVDANISFRDTDERYRLTLWGKNLTDETSRIAANSVAGLWNFTMYDRPLSYGIDVSVFF
jgi:iron complex outermembrane receptor protein